MGALLKTASRLAKGYESDLFEAATPSTEHAVAMKLGAAWYRTRTVPGRRTAMDGSTQPDHLTISPTL